MTEILAVSGCRVRLPEERWQHIVRRHPEMKTVKQQVLDTVKTPDFIQNGDYGELLAIRLWPQTPLTTKYLIVPYQEMSNSDGYILTAYLARRPSSRRQTVWKP